MLFTIFNVFNILIATAMIILILMQRGEGANAGAAFGGGSSGTVFGARGSATFLSRTTAILAGLFFLLSLGMGMHLGHTQFKGPDQSLGVMSGAAAPQPKDAVKTPAKAPAGDVPAASQPAPAAAPTAPTPTPTTGAATTQPTAQQAPASTSDKKTPAAAGK